MGLRETGKRVASTAKLALATAGLSSCIGCGADPPAEPIQCSYYQDGTGLNPTATLVGSQMRVRIRTPEYQGYGWKDTALTDVTGATLLYGDAGGSDTVEFVLDLPPGTSSGSFRFSGTWQATTDCAIARTFTFQVVGPDAGGAFVQFAERSPLPLEARDQATIAVLEDEGDEVWVEARTTFAGPWSPRWDVSAGEILEVRGSRMRWRVPPGAGLHQVELVVDYGERGLSFDSLSLERG